MADYRALSADSAMTQGTVHFDEKDRAFFAQEVPCSSDDLGFSALPSLLGLSYWGKWPPSFLFLYKEATENEGVHAGAEKSADSIGGRVHDGFPTEIERRIHDDRHAGAFAKFIDEPVIERVDFFSTVCGRRCRRHV